MKISTEIGSAAALVGEERAIELIAKAGFDAWDFSMFTVQDQPIDMPDYLAHARKLKEIGLECGIVCNQSHAPFWSQARDNLIFYMQRAIECTAEAGGEICIIHPRHDSSAAENASFYEKLLPFAKEHGVKIAAENVFNWDVEKDESCFAACATTKDFLAHLDLLDDPYLVGCLDIGHAELRGSGDGAANMIRALGSRLKALHIHDNDRRHDYHRIPFSGSIDFKEVITALKEVHYSGYFTLEAIQHLTQFDKETVASGLNEMAEAARKMADMFER